MLLACQPTVFACLLGECCLCVPPHGRCESVGVSLNSTTNEQRSNDRRRKGGRAIMLTIRHRIGVGSALLRRSTASIAARCCLSTSVPSSSSTPTPPTTPLPGREGLIDAQRITVKLGSQVVTRSNGSGIAFGRLFNVVEQLAQLKTSGRDLVIVTSGAVAAGRHRFVVDSSCIRAINWLLVRVSAVGEVGWTVELASRTTYATRMCVARTPNLLCVAMMTT